MAAKNLYGRTGSNPIFHGSTSFGAGLRGTRRGTRGTCPKRIRRFTTVCGVFEEKRPGPLN
ncbi:hypothetical protein GWI33_011301, partial [Rhynchophorus ferrugineus]